MNEKPRSPRAAEWEERIRDFLRFGDGLLHDDDWLVGALRAYESTLAKAEHKGAVVRLGDLRRLVACLAGPGATPPLHPQEGTA